MGDPQLRKALGGGDCRTFNTSASCLRSLRGAPGDPLFFIDAARDARV
jgi:hypothetical protein